MRILFVGDVVGAVGRKMVGEHVRRIKAEQAIDLVIANGENAAHGKGLTYKIYNQLLDYGVDVITMGNHTFSKDVILNFIDDAEYLVRPMNLEPLEYGQYYKVVEVNGKKVCVCNIMCEVFMHNVSESPFACMEMILEDVEADIYFVDLHGEATSEKAAFANVFKNQVQVIVGTHTHVQTADERLIEQTAFISDVGMCGAYDSIIGRDVSEVLTRFLTSEKTRFTVAEGDGMFCAAVIEIDDNNHAVSIERIQIRPN
ncbi:metallophosphoesterase (TIGR00282 family) [Breznakia sp. PF5-3]|uniref:TIGR00282 family metallophosphoesterase n=1 Tax=unclassified Breznakia TaxID=2623764 RepID=UPI002406EF69|nr:MULTISPECIES: TIGR00282 family metallophosphoesterase [unclassified Breznakia]MDF9824625.1 metallophosphoesterase (TIGR00282 family) [Breznakia sp. PM6-1]MDF9835561.1 metallophosphoesterase (TIGR00282 family) [Breznakia sp. PF5-3]MDF9837937.1 metallophosphoesterase (TIGR00282 family) [Breznakia sp. PFB2-8]MDF9859926.1 metallophosphoesterase (TIGR00282 family) [Breznakia sp. PH5-24]